jgi:hypothetical protein
MNYIFFLYKLANNYSYQYKYYTEVDLRTLEVLEYINNNNKACKLCVQCLYV